MLTKIQDVEPQSKIVVLASPAAGLANNITMFVDNIEYFDVNGTTFWDVRDGTFTFTMAHDIEVDVIEPARNPSSVSWISLNSYRDMLTDRS